jgi:chromosome segregation ATPase
VISFTKFLRVLLIACAFCSIDAVLSQSALESSKSIQDRAGAALASFKVSLITTADNPTTLDTLQKSAEECKNALAQLDSEINSQLDHLYKKESSLDSSGLGEEDLKELRNALNKQIAPLKELKVSSMSWEKTCEGFIDSTHREWTSVYSSFADIAGPEKAREKLADRIHEFIKNQNWPN